jgi:uncharacterized protein YegJ (DUF2314 family)
LGLIVIDKLAKYIFFAAVLLTGAIANAAQPFPAGPAQAEVIKFQFAVYYTGAPAGDPLAAVGAIAARNWPALAIVNQLPKDPVSMLLQGRMEMNVPVKYAPPDIKSLGHFGRGLSKAQAEAVQGSKQALQLNFTHPKKHTMQGLLTAYSLAEQVARETGGLLWDEETREMFTPDKWHELRLANWHGGVPEVSKSITIHSYKTGQLVRAITLGMAKFGLPDIVVDQYPWSSGNSMANIINLLAQALAEGAPVGLSGHIDLNINAIANKKMRERELASLKPKALSIAKLALVVGTPEDGDPANRLAEIRFTRYPGPDTQARQDAMLAAMFGYTDNLKIIRHNAELVAASQAAQMKLAGLQAAFARGLRPGEYIQVKAPFVMKGGGNEWMWVEVTRWNDGKIEGLLKSDPKVVTTLRLGQMVHVRQDKVFDYIRHFPDGREEGNTTSKIIEKMNAKTD